MFFFSSENLLLLKFTLTNHEFLLTAALDVYDLFIAIFKRWESDGFIYW